jgi:hypothetical protein
MPVNKNILAFSDTDGYGSGLCWIGSSTVIENKLNTDPDIRTWFRTTFHDKFFTKVLPSMYCHGSNLPYIPCMLALKRGNYPQRSGSGNPDPTKFGLRSTTVEAWHSRTEQLNVEGYKYKRLRHL